MLNLRKKLIALTLGIGLAFSSVGIAAAAVTPEQAAQIQSWHQQRLAEREAVLQSYVDAGIITAEQMQAALERMKARFAAREAAGFVNCRAIQPDGSFLPNPRGTGLGLGLGFGNGRGQGMGPGLGNGAGQGLGFRGGVNR